MYDFHTTWLAGVATHVGTGRVSGQASLWNNKQLPWHIAVRCRRSERWQWSDSEGTVVLVRWWSCAGCVKARRPGLKLSFGTVSVLFWCVLWRPQCCCTAVKQRLCWCTPMHCHVCALLSPPGSQIFEGTGQCQSALFDYWCLCPSSPLRMHETCVRTHTQSLLFFLLCTAAQTLLTLGELRTWIKMEP